MFFCFSFSIKAQTLFDNYSISKLSPDDGLSQGSNYFKYEDSKGFMWLTCNDALNRFDGKTVKVYNLDKYFDKCSNLQQGYGFTEDKEGNIYIGSVRGLYIYHRKEDRFSLQKIFKNTTDDIAMPIGFHDGKIWCFNKQYQLATYDIKTKKTTLVTQLQLEPLKSIHIYEMSNNCFYYHYPFFDSNGKIWIINNNEILKFDIKTNKSYFPLKDYFSTRNANFTVSSFDNITNSFFIGTDNGLFEYNIEDNKIKEIINQGKNFGQILGLSAKGNLLAFRTNFDIFFLDNKSNVLKKIPVNDKNNYNRTFGYSIDKSNRLWICDDGKGQLIFDFHSKLLPKIPDESTSFNYFNLSGVTRFLQLSDNEIVIPNIIQGRSLLLVYNMLTKKMTDIPFSMVNSETINYGCATDLNRKGVWLYSQDKNNNEVVLRISFLNQLKKIDNLIVEKSYLEKGSFQDLQVLHNGKIVCAFTKGLYWLNVETKSLEKMQTANQTNLFKINYLDEKEVAISYINSDMILYQLQSNNSFKVVKNILPNIQSFYIQKDKKRNQYWVGTNQGVYLLDKNLKTKKIFNANNGLAGTYIYGLLLDDDGNVFCSHQRGLSSINATTFQVTNYDKNDGIQDWDFNNRAFYKATDGTLFFGGVSGFNYFKPPLQPYSYYKPEVYIDEIFVNNNQYNATTNANLIQKLNLNYKENNISIHAIVKDLANANARQLIYRIKEIDSKWKHLPNGTAINFSNLAPNNYTLELGYYDKYLNKEVSQKIVLISISAPFYSEIWFWSLIAFLLTAIVFWFYNKRKFAKQQQEFQQQLALEQQRSKITADLHDDIGATLSSLQINSAVANQLLEKNPKEAQKVLIKIENQSQNLADKIGDIIWSMKPNKDQFMSMSSRIKNFANDILGATNINYTLKIDSKIDEKITDITTRKNIVLIVKEAINNVAKYSKATQLNVHIDLIENSITIKIIDDGIGFDATQTKGNGIGNMKKRAEELKGNLDISSIENKGTTILVTIPCP
ncbi:sensor histidine kinase [Flavobacterium koreense]